MLESINCPEDLKNLKYWELQALADEMRKEIAEVISNNGGHLASNLGIVETTIALHRVFDFSKDKLIFDVGHQCYAHKILTGRNDRFSTIRKKDGLSGFTNRFESEYDTLTAGHSGPSVSAGLGIAEANKLLGKDDYVISVVGDGSFTNGMIYEALNNCCEKDLKFIVILNDNEMSISSNVGNLSKHFAKLRTSKRYFKLKRRVKKFFIKIPLIGKGLVRLCGRIKDFFKRVLLKDDGFFAALDMKHLGPVDGHDIKKLEDVLEEAKSSDECCLILIKTKKGKGYEKAENNPENYHSVGKFDLVDGVNCASKTNFSEEFGKIMVDRASKDDKIVALTAAMCDGTGLLEFSEKFPDRFFDVGIAEEHEVAFSSGLAVGGMKPVCAVYSTFSQRIYDQAFHDISVQNLPCVFALDRAGFVPDDGITHQGLFDVSLFSSIPNTRIYSPETYEEMGICFDKALSDNCLSIVRYPKGAMTDYDRSGFVSLENGSVSILGGKKSDVVIVTYGRICKNAYDAYLNLSEKYNVTLIKLVSVYPINYNLLADYFEGTRLVYLLEEGIKSGGVAEKISSQLSGRYDGRVCVKAVDNEHAFHASVDELFEHFKMTSDDIVKDIKEILESSEVFK